MPRGRPGALLVAAGRRVAPVADKVALVRRIYEEFARGEMVTMTEHLAPDAHFVNPPCAVEGGVCAGADEFLGAIETFFDMFDYEQVEASLMEEGDDYVLAEFRSKATAKGSGVPLDAKLGHVWTIRDRTIEQFEWFSTYEEAVARFEKLSGRSSPPPG